MKRGRKPLPASEKANRGTWRADRDGQKVQVILAADNNGPIMPEFLLDEENPLAVIAQQVWIKFHPIVTAFGCTEGDSNLFARYCMLEADARALMAAGVLPSTAKMTQLRQMEELLRIAGPKSRVGQKPSGDGGNPFTRNGKR